MSKIIIDTSADVTSRLGFEVYPAYENMCLGYLNNVSVETAESKADAKWEFAGLQTPRLVFEFVQHKDNFNDKDRFFIKSELCISTQLADGTERKPNDIVGDYIELWRRVKHIYDQYSKYAVKPLTVTPEFDPEAGVEERLEQFTKFFSTFAEAFNTNGEGNTPIYANYGGKTNSKLVTMKLVATGVKNSYLSFPKYVGKGFIEPAEFVNNKFKTTLKFGANETPITGSVAVKAPTNVMSEVMNEDIMNIIKGNS
jgi:hypothetical protein